MSDPRQREWSRTFFMRHRAEKAEYTRQWRALNREKFLAHAALANAIARGKLERGLCAVCGDERVVGHHADYSKRLDVTWLCYEHHYRVHHV